MSKKIAKALGAKLVGEAKAAAGYFGANQTMLNVWDLFPNAHPGMCIRGLRCRDGMIQKDLAKQLGVSVRALRAMEHGDVPIPKDIAKKLAKLFNSHEDIFGDEE